MYCQNEEERDKAGQEQRNRAEKREREQEKGCHVVLLCHTMLNNIYASERDGWFSGSRAGYLLITDLAF